MKFLLILSLFYFSSIIAQDQITYIDLGSDIRLSKSQITKEILVLSSHSVYKWEVRTENNAIVFGIAATPDDALKHIHSFSSRNKNHYYKLGNYHSSMKVYASTILCASLDVVADFYKISSRPYQIFNKDDLMAIDIYQNYDKQKGIRFYQNTNRISYNQAEENIIRLTKMSNFYRIKN